MKKLQKERLEKGGGNLPRQKIKLSRRTKIVSFIFSVMTILTTAGIMQAANVYYDLDTSTIMVNDAQTMSLGLTVSGAAVSLNNNSNFATNINTGTSTGAVSIGGNLNTVAINSSNWDVSSTGTVSNAIVNLRAGTTVAGTAPLKFISGTNLGTTEAGAVEFDGTHLYFTATDSGTRYQLDQQAGTTYSAGGTLLNLTGGVFSVNEGTLTDGMLCTYNSAGTEIECTTSSASVGHDPLTIAADTGTTPTEGGATVDGSQVITLQAATATTGGVVSDETQSFLGAKTLVTSVTSTGLLTASNGLTLTTGALNLTGTSGALALSGLSASSINSGSNDIIFTSGHFTTTATGINSTPIGATTASTGAFTTLGSTGITTLASTAGSVFTIGNSTGVGTLVSGGTSSWANTAGELTIKTLTSGDITLSTVNVGDEINLDPYVGGAGVIRLGAGDQILTSGGGAATRLAGEEILVGQVNIFGYDYPAQTAATVFKDISRVMEDDPFPAVATGTTRGFKFIIRYADTLTVTEGPSLWNFYDVTTPGSSIAFTLPYSPGVDLDKGTVGIVDATAGMKTLIEADGDWNLQVRLDNSATGKSIRVYSIDLAAYDVVD